MTATYTFDAFSSLDGFGSVSRGWGGYWGKQGPEFLTHRLEQYASPQRMVFGATTFRLFVGMLAASVITGETGIATVFGGAADFDLDLLESRTFDGRIQQLVYRPTLHV